MHRRSAPHYSSSVILQSSEVKYLQNGGFSGLDLISGLSLVKNRTFALPLAETKLQTDETHCRGNFLTESYIYYPTHFKG